MHPYLQRNVRAWHRRFSKLGWTVRVLDRAPSSALNVANYLDISDPTIFPRAFRDETIGGEYAPQHTSDLVRWPLLLRYGGIYADTGIMQIGDVDRLWRETVADPDSPFDVLCYKMGDEPAAYTNYFLASARDNPLFERCHRLLLALWAEEGGKTSTEDMHASPLLREAPLVGSESMSQDLKVALSDYIVQGRAMSMVLGLVDEAEGWNGPAYAVQRVYGIEYMQGSQLTNELTDWNGPRQFELLSLRMPGEGEAESPDQKAAREMVEACLSRSFAVKLAHGLIVKVQGDTLGSLWRKNVGSDDVPGTYAHWLRHGMTYWSPEGLPPAAEVPVFEPFKRGRLLEGS